VHRSGDEAAWWGNTGVDPTVAARALWLGSHPLRMDQEEPTLNRSIRAAPAYTIVTGNASSHERIPARPERTQIALFFSSPLPFTGL
jgi:hypothetical protein